VASSGIHYRPLFRVPQLHFSSDSREKLDAEIKTEDKIDERISTITSDMSTKEKVKFYFNRYGYTFVGTYLSIYGLTLSSIFLALNYDVFSAASFGYDPVELIKKVSYSIFMMVNSCNM
jgi:hypothetical protein